MAHKTFGFKVTEEVYDHAKMLINISELSSKDWFENALEYAAQLATSQEQTEEARRSNENERLKAKFSEERAELTKTTTAQINELRDALNASTEKVKALSGEISSLSPETEREN